MHWLAHYAKNIVDWLRLRVRKLRAQQHQLLRLCVYRSVSAQHRIPKTAALGTKFCSIHLFTTRCHVFVLLYCTDLPHCHSSQRIKSKPPPYYQHNNNNNITPHHPLYIFHITHSGPQTPPPPPPTTAIDTSTHSAPPRAIIRPLEERKRNEPFHQVVVTNGGPNSSVGEDCIYPTE